MNNFGVTLTIVEDPSIIYGGDNLINEIIDNHQHIATANDYEKNFKERLANTTNHIDNGFTFKNDTTVYNIQKVITNSDGLIPLDDQYKYFLEMLAYLNYLQTGNTNTKEFILEQEI